MDALFPYPSLNYKGYAIIKSSVIKYMTKYIFWQKYRNLLTFIDYLKERWTWTQGEVDTGRGGQNYVFSLIGDGQIVKHNNRLTLKNRVCL